MAGIANLGRVAINTAAGFEPLESLLTNIAALVGKVTEPKQTPSADLSIPVDAVYLWVDDQDVTWLKKRAEFSPSQNADQASVSKSRFRQFGELIASIQMLANHAPFIRNVHIVVDNQLPDLSALPKNLPFKIILTNHTDFMPAQYLPTYSSRALTANLHRIEGLAENYLYLNDDVFIAKPSTAADWFTKTGTRLRYSSTPMPSRSTLDKNEVIYNARWHTIDLASAKGWKTIEAVPEHGPHPMLKSTMQKLWVEFESEMQNVSSEKFRTPNGLLPEWLHNLCVINDSKAELVTGSGYKYIAINKRSSLAAIVSMLINRGRILTVCLNDAAEVSPSESLSDAQLARRISRVLRLMV